MVHEFIDKIVVYHREERFGEMVQKVEIYYKMVGYLEGTVKNYAQIEE